MKKILIVDDDKLMRDGVAKALADHGYQVEQAGNGKEGFESAKANVPDMIITDIMMPEMDGVTMLEQIRETEWGKQLAAIVLTIRDSDIEVINKTLKTGAAAYISKADFTPDQLISAVDLQLKSS
jgi:DNA-binding response OmpR family regulator